MPSSSGSDEMRSPIVGVIGLGRMGRAISFALQGAKGGYEVWGHDREPERVREAKAAGAIDKGDWNLISVAEASNLLFITEPVEQLADTLRAVAPHLREGTVVTDTASLKVPVLAAADACLPGTVSFVGGHPVPALPRAADEAGQFTGATYCLVPHPAADDNAVRTLSRLVGAIGARPFYIGAEEHDALIAGVSLLPYLAEVSLVRILGASPSAADLKMLAGPKVAGLTKPSEGRSATSAYLQADRSGLLAWIDQLLAQLGELRAAVAAGDAEEIDGLLAEAEEIGSRWADLGNVETAEAAAFDEVYEYDATRHLLLGGFLRRRTE